MNIAKKRAKAHAALRAEKGGDEPVISQENYLNTISDALKWYSDNQEKKLRKYALEYFAKKAKKPEVIAIDKATDFEIRQLGILCRLNTREQYLTDEHITRIDAMASDLVTKYSQPQKKKVEKEAVATTPMVSVPFDLISRSAARVSAVSPDWLMVISRVSGSMTGLR